MTRDTSTNGQPLADRLAIFLTEHAGRAATVLACRPMTGGYSRVMTTAEVEWEDGEREHLVLRADPPAGTVMLDTDRRAEWRLMQALHASSLRVPRPRAFDETGEHLGTPTIVMDHVPGQTLQSLLRESQPDLVTYRRLWVDALADVHLTTSDPASSGLLATLPAPASWDERIDQLIAVYDDTERQLAQRDPVLRFVSTWLRENRPEPVPLTLVHGDFNPSNAHLHDGELTVLDWEFARIGDPREDLGYYFSYAEVVGPSLLDRDADAFLAQYRERTGFSERQINLPVVIYFALLASMSIGNMIFKAATAMHYGRTGGTMLTYNLNAISLLHGKLLERCLALDKPMRSLRSTTREHVR